MVYIKFTINITCGIYRVFTVCCRGLSMAASLGVCTLLFPRKHAALEHSSDWGGYHPCDTIRVLYVLPVWGSRFKSHLSGRKCNECLHINTKTAAVPEKYWF